MTHWVVSLVTLTMCASVSVAAQTQEPRAAPFVRDIVTKVVLDPTTYVPGMLTYGAMRLDWNSSQVFFRNGYVEQHAGYTVSGVGNTASVSREIGNRRIAADSLKVLQLSLVHNVAERVIERGLTRRYPAHRRLVRVAGHVERIVAAAYVSYAMSAVHFRQTRKNNRLARQFGYD